MNKRTSPIWLLPENEFRDLVELSVSYTEMLTFFGFQNKGRNAHTLKQRISELGIPVDHVVRDRGKSGPRTHTNENIFIENSPVSRSCARKRILKDNLLPYTCQLCPQGTTWQGKPLTLVLDHINGNPIDHRLNNLRFLCPNCNSQTDTFAGRNK